MDQNGSLQPGAITEELGERPPEPRSAAPACIIVIPCYNEAARLQPQEFIDFVRHNSEIGFLFVNDGSRDATLSVLHELAAANPGQLQVLDLQPNRGKAEAVRAGFLHAMSEPGTACVGFWDADLATPLSSIPKLLSKLIEQPSLQMVFGARVRLLGRKVNRKSSRHYLGRAFATAASLTLRLPIYDTQCGAKIFRATPDLARVMSGPFVSRWIFDVEIIARFLSLHGKDTALVGESIYEYPLPGWTDVAGSKVKSTDFFKAFGGLIRIYLSELR